MNIEESELSKRYSAHRERQVQEQQKYDATSKHLHEEQEKKSAEYKRLFTTLIAPQLKFICNKLIGDGYKASVGDVPLGECAPSKRIEYIALHTGRASDSGYTHYLRFYIQGNELNYEASYIKYNGAPSENFSGKMLIGKVTERSITDIIMAHLEVCYRM